MSVIKRVLGELKLQLYLSGELSKTAPCVSYSIDRLPSLSLSAEEAIKLFSSHAGKLPWKYSDESNRYRPNPSFRVEDGSRFVQCSENVYEQVLRGLGIEFVSNGGLPAFLLFMTTRGNMHVHLDPSLSVPSTPFGSNVSQLVERLQTQPIHACCVHVEAGGVISFVGSKLHAVKNVQDSFSCGIHYPLTQLHRGKTKVEAVVYFVFCGKKIITLFDIDPQLEAFVDSLNIEVQDAMFDQESAAESLRSAALERAKTLLGENDKKCEGDDDGGCDDRTSASSRKRRKMRAM